LAHPVFDHQMRSIKPVRKKSTMFWLTIAISLLGFAAIMFAIE
jgi:hypothetical protein